MLTWVEIDTKAINHNLKTFRAVIGQDRALMPVIKSNAYGHGLEIVGKLCDQNPAVTMICVVNLEEALELLRFGIKKSILVLGIFEHDSKKVLQAIRKKVSFPLYTYEQAIFLNTIAARAKTKVRVHVKIDTGTSRIGIMPEEAVVFVAKVKKLPNVVVEGLWSHFSSSENDPRTTKKQQRIFETVEHNLLKQGIEIPQTHMACSASTLLYPTNCRAVRFGISVYGLHPDKTTQKSAKLKPALSWRTTIIQLKTITKGTKISYGGTYTVKRATKLAIVPVGYWDGLPRSASNKAEVLVGGKRCRIRGRICMNLCMVDVTDVKNVATGDIVTIIGKDGREMLSADELAQRSGTINYEIIARINPLIPRVAV